MAKQKKSKSNEPLGSGFRKAQPKLRVVANGNFEVNEMRALQCGAVGVSDEKRIEDLKAAGAPSMAPAVTKTDVRKASKGKQKELSSDISVNVFIQGTRHYQPGSLTKGEYTIPTELVKDDGGTRETAQTSNLVTARVKMSDLPTVLESSRVTYVELAENLRVPDPIVADENPLEPNENERFIEHEKEKHGFGEDVFVGIIDVGGFDFAHPDFIDEDGNTRFVGIWDQGGDSRPSPFHVREAVGVTIPEIFNYGSEIVQDHMNAAIKAAPNFGLAATELEPQSQMSPGSHGTHVASIAAGNKGVARKAKIAAVLVNIPNEGTDDYGDRRWSFFDSTQLAHAVDYLMTLAAGRPISINISLGTNGHAHDGTSPICRWIDSWLDLPNAAVTVAAGNAGQEAASSEGDLGYILGRIHTSGKIPARGLTTDIELHVMGDGDQDISENELEIWYSAQDEFSVQVRPPGMDWTKEVLSGEFIENLQMPNRSLLSIYNERYHPANGLNCISVYLSPYMKEKPFVGSKSGLWKIRLRGVEVRDGSYHAWIERDDPRRIEIEDGKTVWFLPSFFSERSNVDNSSVSSLACGNRIISVANLDAINESINITSSQGPTRDGRTKPDIAAPGTDIVAAKGFSNGDGPWISMSGTSMASPFIAGLIALMLGVNPKLTAAQIEGIIRSTAEPLPGASYDWIDSAGFGRIDSKKCIDAALIANDRKDVTK